jgi:hypothetical protein
VTSNLDTSEWTDAFPNRILAEATIDRLRHGAYTVVLEGKSYRSPSGITRTDPGYAHETGPSGVDEAWIIVCGYTGDIQIGYRCFPFHISL